MTQAELKKYLKKLDKDTLEDVLLQLHKNQLPDRKELFEISLKNAAEHQTLPPKDAIIPKPASIMKRMERIFDDCASSYSFYYYLRASKRRKYQKDLKDVFAEMQSCPVQAKKYDEIMDLFYEFYDTCYRMASNVYSTGIDPYATLKIADMDMYMLIIKKGLAPGFGMEKMRKVLRFAILPCPMPDPWLHLDHLETFLSCLKVNDQRFELMEYLEHWMKNPEELFDVPAREDIPDQQLSTFWYGFFLLYMELASTEMDTKQAIQTIHDLCDPVMVPIADSAIDDWIYMHSPQQQEEMQKTGSYHHFRAYGQNGKA